VRFSSKEPLQFGRNVRAGILDVGTSVKRSPVSFMAPFPFFLSKCLLTPGSMSKPYADLRVPFSGVQSFCHVLGRAKDPRAPGTRDEPRASRPGDVGTRHWTSPTAKLSGCPGDGEIRFYRDPSGAIQRHPDRTERCFRTLGHRGSEAVQDPLASLEDDDRGRGHRRSTSAVEDEVALSDLSEEHGDVGGRAAERCRTRSGPLALSACLTRRVYQNYRVLSSPLGSVKKS